MKKKPEVISRVINFSLMFLILVLMFAIAGYAQVEGYLSVEDDELYAGEYTQLHLNVTNYGFANVRNVEVQVNIPEELGYNWLENIDLIEADSSRLFDKTINTYSWTEAGSYEIKGTVKFANKENIIQAVTLDVLEFPLKIEYSLEESTLDVVIQNIMDKPLQDVVLEVVFPEDFEVNETTPLLSSLLGAGQEMSKTFLFSTSGLQGTYYIELHVSFIDAWEQHEYVETVDVELGSIFGFGLIELVVGIVILLLIARLAAARLK